MQNNFNDLDLMACENEIYYDNKNVKCCNNCGKPGHLYSQCKIPITSVGIIAFRYRTRADGYRVREYLMICRKDTLGYIDFMRGKYLVKHKEYIKNMIKQMTNVEKENLKNCGFDELWKNIWGSKLNSNKYKIEEEISREKFNLLKKEETSNLVAMIDEVDCEMNCGGDGGWIEPEWGFPKGRRSYQEKDYDCAIREFCEETGYASHILKNIQNILPFEEIFVGSNYKSYKHKYYLMHIDYADTENILFRRKTDNKEVSKMEWKTFDEGLSAIRYYNIEKIKILKKINDFLDEFIVR